MIDPLLLPELREMLIEHEAPAMREFCNVLHPAVVAENLEALSDEDLLQVLRQAEMPRQAEVFAFISLPRQVALVDTMDNAHLSALLEEMASDDRTILLSEMDEDHVDRLLPLIAQAERSEIRKLLSYPENSAGSLMTTEYASLPEALTTRDALSQLRLQAPDRETIYYIYVLDEGRHLRGLVSLRKLILAKPEALVAQILDRDVISLRVTDDQDTVVQQMAKYDFIAMPVVDDQNRLVGIITHDDVLDLVQDLATEELQRMGAVEPLEDGYMSTPFLTLAWKRGVWLVLLLVAGFGTSAVLQAYRLVSQKYEWLGWFLPLVLASGGNAGSQTATLVIRTIALGGLARGDHWRMLRREFLTGISLGLCLAIMGTLFAWQYQDLHHALIVGVTIAAVITFGTVNGTILPIVLRRLGMDPALMSNPLIAAISDVLGVLVYYNMALFVLEIVAKW